MTTDRPERRLPLVRLLPNLMTVSALCAGVTAIRFAVEGHFKLAVALILLAAILDGLDGRLARLLRSESQIGAELDSLCDFVNFGVAPGFIIWLWALQDMKAAGWIAVLVYVVACLMRLARFNLGNRAIDKTAEQTGFQGVPSPAGAMLVFLPMFLAFTLQTEPFHGGLIALYMALVGGMMVGRFRTPSFKQVSFAARYVRYILLGFVALIAAMLAYPWVTLVAVDLGYLIVVLVSLMRGTSAPTEEEEPLDGA